MAGVMFHRNRFARMARGNPRPRHEPGKMNGLERAFFAELQTWPNVAAIEFERITLKLADDTRYTPDFYVLFDDGRIALYQVKGFMEDHSRVKCKVAADLFPEFEHWLVHRRAKKDGGGWDIRLIGGDGHGSREAASE